MKKVIGIFTVTSISAKGIELWDEHNKWGLTLSPNVEGLKVGLVIELAINDDQQLEVTDLPTN